MPKTKASEPSYEKAVTRLEDIVEELEGGKLELDLLAERLKEAKELLALCRKKLTKVETDVKNILEDGKE